MTESAAEKVVHPAHAALDRLMQRMGGSHSEHAEPDRVILCEAIDASIHGAPAVSRSEESLKAEVDRLIETINGLRNVVTDRDASIASRDEAINERDSRIVELTTGRDNALTLCDTLTTKFSGKITLVRSCLDSSVLETDATKLQAIRTAIDAE